MTFKKLRRCLFNNGPQIVQWSNSGIVEHAELEPNGAIRITNLVTKKSYILPKSYPNINIRIIKRGKFVSLGSLLPK